MTAKALTTAPEYVLTIVSGPDKGAAFKIVSGRISIGRGSENDIVLDKDVKVSRNHAWITVTTQGVEVTDISDKNKVIVDGNETPKQLLKDRSVIQLGETKIQLRTVSQEKSIDLASPKKMGISFDSFSKAKVNRPTAPSKQNLIIFGALALIAIYFWSKPKAVNKNVTEIRSDEALARDLSSIESETARIQTERMNRGATAPNYNEINSHFTKGYRDYHNGNYQRAVESFQACLSLMPSHEQCQKYYNDSSRGFWSLVDSEMIRGLKLKEQSQFTACAATFENVKNLVTDQTNKKYLEAEANRKYCDERAKDRF